MRAAIQIALKDLRQRMRDRSAIMLGIIAPLGLAFIFSLIIPDIDDINVGLGVVDADGGPIAAVFVADVLEPLAADGLFTLVRLESEAEAASGVESGKVDAAVVLPAGFSAAVAAAEPGVCDADGCVAAEIGVLGHVDRQLSAQIAEAVSSGFAGQLTGVRVALATAFELNKADVGAVSAAAAAASPQIAVSDEVAGSKQLGLSTFFSAGMAIFFLFFTVQFGVSSLLAERTFGTMPRLLAAPIRWWQIVAGKALAAFVLGVVAMVVLIAGSTAFIGAEWGNPVGVGLLVIASVLAAIGIMAVIATLAKTAEQAANWQAIVAVVLGMLGGTFFPVSQAPGILSRLSLLTPHAWFMRGLGDLSNGGGAGDALPATLAIVMFALVALSFSALRVKRMVAP
ncbi:MAG TPA: ABC transporter permease [Acidimicrobiia bacterium]|jgi:ABC-2 type transport system permease protein|nr:ABC transporter permease [Acidimicrobiia bacterium]